MIRFAAALKALLFLGIFIPLLTRIAGPVPSLPRLAVLLAGTGAFLWAEKRTWLSVGICGPRRFAPQLLLGSAIGLGSSLTLVLALAALGCRWGWGDPGQALSQGLVFLSVATFEELAFRGYVFFRLREAIGGPAVVLVSSVLFASLHGLHGSAGDLALPALSLALASISVAFATLETGLIGAAIGLHFAWNVVLGALFGFNLAGHPSHGLFAPILGGPEWLTGGAFGPAAGLPGLLILGATFAWMFHARGRLFRCQDRSPEPPA